jgi:hypothetical protein
LVPRAKVEAGQHYAGADVAANVRSVRLEADLSYVA